MAIITKIVNGKKYLYEKISYREDGKVKTKWTCLGRIDENGDLIPSKKNRRKAMKDAPAELVIQTTKTKYIIRKKHEKKKEETAPEISEKTAPVDKMLLDLNKISQKAFNPDVNIALYQETPRKIAMERKGSEKEISTLVAINFDSIGITEKGLTIRGTEKLTQFDKIVLDAVNSLLIEGHNEYVTSAMIFHVMTGDLDRRITQNYAEEISNSLTKLLFTHIVIKANEEATMYPELRNFEYHDTIIPGSMIKAKLNGTEVACIHIRDIPPLYLYASKKKQISKIDLDLIKLPFANDKKENTEHMTLLHYLLRRIVALKSVNNHIKYDTIYHELGHDNATKQKKLQLRKNVKKILDAWKGSLFGDIELIDYTEEKNGQIPYEIIINFKIHT